MLIKAKKKLLNLTKNEIYFGLTFFAFIFIALAFIFYGPNFNGTDKSVTLEIKSGSNFNQIIDSLYKKNVISNKTNFKVASLLFGVDKNVKAGRYEIEDGISYIELLKLLNKGTPQAQVLVTIQEGIWQKDLAELLNKELEINKKEFLNLSKDQNFIDNIGLDVKNLEGYLLPETYYFYEGSTAKDVIKRLYSEMRKVFDLPEVKVQMKNLNMTEHQILTMASIIDGESNQVDEFKRISGVYHNRIKKGWKLQADPTVQYVVRQRRSKVNKIYYKDLEIDSRYNTYKYYGLPPSPINNPGKDAIMAAVFPEKHNFMYFVADGTGGHVFSRTSREHQIQVGRYRDWRRNNR